MKIPITNTYEAFGSLARPVHDVPHLKRFTPQIRFGCGNGRSQATVRQAVRRRSNLPKAMQRRLGFKCH